jgi:hypothetical protein
MLPELFSVSLPQHDTTAPHTGYQLDLIILYLFSNYLTLYVASIVGRPRHHGYVLFRSLLLGHEDCEALQSG